MSVVAAFLSAEIFRDKWIRATSAIHTLERTASRFSLRRALKANVYIDRPPGEGSVSKLQRAPDGHSKFRAASWRWKKARR